MEHDLPGDASRSHSRQWISALRVWRCQNGCRRPHFVRSCPIAETAIESYPGRAIFLGFGWEHVVDGWKWTRAVGSAICGIGFCIPYRRIGSDLGDNDRTSSIQEETVSDPDRFTFYWLYGRGGSQPAFF